ncbi:LysR family transcriptional regulator [Paracoccus kondratievae]|nr:LysR family transcriptional regulator [Paracoccus kondratievae]
MDSLGSMNAFVRAAETRSFTKAGAQLGVSSSAVGKAVARLEGRLGVRLFHRSTRTITLTAEGTLFLERCRRIFSEIETAEIELSQTRDAPRGKLKVSLPLVGMLMMPTLSAFMRTWPDIELDLDFSDRLVDVIDEGYDAVVRTGDTTDSRLMMRVLGSFGFKLVGSASYFSAHGTPKTLSDLVTHRCLRHRYPTSGLEDWLHDGHGNKITFQMTTAVTSSAIEPLIQLAKDGHGIACLPDFAVQEQLDDGSLVSVMEHAVRHSSTYRILWPSSRQLAPKISVFVDFMAANLFKPRPISADSQPDQADIGAVGRETAR